MYLTNDEFLILQGIKQKMTITQIQKTYGIKMYTNDPRIDSLSKKYGVDMSNQNWREELSQKADLNKVVVCSKEDMPYYNYDQLSLVKRIPISKGDVIQLLKAFEEIKEFNDEDYYLLQFGSSGLGSSIYLLDNNGEKHHIRSWVDGDIYEGEDKKGV